MAPFCATNKDVQNWNGVGRHAPETSFQEGETPPASPPPSFLRNQFRVALGTPPGLGEAALCPSPPQLGRLTFFALASAAVGRLAGERIRNRAGCPGYPTCSRQVFLVP